MRPLGMRGSPSSSATRPPMLWPIKCARSSPSASSSRDDAARLELRSVGGAERLVGVAEAEQVDGDRPEGRRERRDRRQERGLRAAEPVQHQDGGARARPRSPSSSPASRLDRARKRSRPGPVVARRGGEEADAEVKVLAHPQAAARGTRPCRSRRRPRSRPRSWRRPRAARPARPCAARRAALGRARRSRPTRWRPGSRGGSRPARPGGRTRRGRSGRRACGGRPVWRSRSLLRRLPRLEP